MNQVIRNYRDNDKLRHSFNELAKKTFGIDFEDWYQNGYWTDRYNPYSIVMDGKVVANVSVNTTDFEINGERKRYIQLGTVMTEEEYRNKGLIRKIMEEIQADYEDKVDGVYLFANDEVLSFYPKFGFEKSKEFEYFMLLEKAQNTDLPLLEQPLFEKIPMGDKKEWDKLETKIKRSFHQSSFEMLDNSQLNMFYVSKYMQENVYYSKELNTYVIAEVEDDTLIVDMVIADTEQDLKRIAHGFGKEINKVIFGFTPKSTEGFEVRELNQDDCTLFVKGDLALVEDSKMMFPLLAHA